MPPFWGSIPFCCSSVGRDFSLLLAAVVATDNRRWIDRRHHTLTNTGLQGRAGSSLISVLLGVGCEQVATCFLGAIGGAGILAAMRLIVSVVTPLAEGLEIARVAVLGHVIHMRDGQNYPHDPQRSYVITVAPSLRAFLRPFEAQAIVAKRPRLVPDSSRRPSAKLVVGNAAELAAIARAFTNSGADDWPVFRVSRAVFSLDRHHTLTALQTASMRRPIHDMTFTAIELPSIL